MLDHAAASMPPRPQRPPRLPGLDHTLAWLLDPAGFLARCRRSQPADVVEVRWLWLPTLWVLAPEAAARLRDDHRFSALDRPSFLQWLLRFGTRRAPGLRILALRTRHALVWRGWHLPAGRTLLVADCRADRTQGGPA